MFKNLKFKIDSSGLLRLTKKSLIMSFIALIVFTGSGLYLLMRPKQASAAWLASLKRERSGYDVTTGAILNNL